MNHYVTETRHIECVQCYRYLSRNFMSIRGACASVGIEHGMSTGEMMAVHLRSYHELNGHEGDAVSGPDFIEHDEVARD